MINLDELERMANAATPGPWEHSQDVVFCATGFSGRKVITCCEFLSDAAFVAAVNPETVQALVARVRKLETALKPFAELAPFYHADNDALRAWNIDYQPTVGDLRLARDTLEDGKTMRQGAWTTREG